MSDIPFYLPPFLHKLWLSHTNDACSRDIRRIHTYDISAHRLSEMRRVPWATRDIFCDLADPEDNYNEASLIARSHQPSHQEGQETPVRASLHAANSACLRLEHDAEVVLDRILSLVTVAPHGSPLQGSPLQDGLHNSTTTRTTATAGAAMRAVTTTTTTSFVLNGRDLEVLRRYFVFLRFRNSSVYAEMVRRMSSMHHGEQKQQPEPDEGQQGMQDGEQDPCWPSSAQEQKQAFLAGAAHFLGLHQVERADLGNTELLRHCWQLCDAQVSFGLAPPRAEYLHTEQLFGSVDDSRVHHDDTCFPSVAHRHSPSFFLPVSPDTALYISRGLANTPGITNGTVLINCVHEGAAEVHLRNAAMLLRGGSIGCGRSRVVYFSSLRAAAESLRLIGGRSSDGNENNWCHRLREQCLEKHALEAADKVFVFSGDNDDEEEDGEHKWDDIGEVNTCQVGVHYQRQQGQELEGSGTAARLVVKDLTGEVTFQLERGPCGFGSLADVYKGELTLPHGVNRGTHISVAVKCMRRHAAHNHMKSLRNEVAVWHTLQHLHIAQLFGVVRLENGGRNGTGNVWLGMVSSWCDNGTITQYLANNPSANRLRLLVEVALGCSYLHNYSPVVIHGDLKGSNILVDADGRAIITDFGLSRVVEEVSLSDDLEDDEQNILEQRQALVPTSSSRSTAAARWLAPELMRALARDGPVPLVSTASDVYAFGCVCLEVVTGNMPFPRLRNNCAVIVHVLTRGAKPFVSGRSEPAVPGLPPRAQPQFWALLDRCWSAQPSMRPSIDDVLRLLSHLHAACA